MDLTGKTALITGASRGIGAATARIFAEAGANVALAARDRDALAALASEIGARAIATPCDISQFGEVREAVAACVAATGRLDILIGNAGVIDPIAPLEEADPEAWGKAIDINLKGVFHGMRAAMPVMREAGGGTIITVSSGAAHSPLEGWSQYCAAKASAAMLTRSAHLEGAPHGLRVMGLSPGTVATDMQRRIRRSGINPVSALDWSDHIPPEWPAKALLWMCGPEADPWCGEEISLRDPEIRQKAGVA